MAGYTIAFDGAHEQNGNKNIVTTANSLEQTVTGTVRTPSSGGYFAGTWENDAYDGWNVVPNDYETGDPSNQIWVCWKGTIWVISAPASTTSWSTGGYTYYKGAVVGTWDFGSSQIYRIGPGNIQTALTSITPTTDTEGESLVGGVDLNINSLLTQTGAPNATLPSTKFGVEAKHNGTKLIENKHLSPVVSLEGMKTETEVVTLFDPAATDITFEVTGANESQHITDINVIVEEL